MARYNLSFEIIGWWVMKMGLYHFWGQDRQTVELTVFSPIKCNVST